MLFAQVTNLQKLVDNKTEEIVMLKRQLATKNTLNELGTLSEQLREARRETAMWKKRALMAEKRLERLSQMVPDSVHGLDDDTVSMLDTASEGVFIRHSLLSESGDDTGISLDSQGQAQVRRSMQHGGGGMDGVMSSEGSYESAGTVMITRRNRSSVNLLDFSSGVDVLGMELLQPLLPVKEGAKELEELQQPLMGAQHVSVHIEQMAELE